MTQWVGASGEVTEEYVSDVNFCTDKVREELLKVIYMYVCLRAQIHVYE